MYTTNDQGILNNYSTEGKISYAQYPTVEQQQNYIKLGALAGAFVSVLLAIAVLVS
jgi:hypothetical protein